MFKCKIFSFVIIACLLVGGAAMGAVSGGKRTISKIGCHATDRTCYVYIEGEPAGPENCLSVSYRWNMDDHPGGRELLSLLYGAYLSGKKVVFMLNDSCLARDPRYPQIEYIVVVE